MITYLSQLVKYHSCQWMVLVETGWITATVDNQYMALMIKPI